MVAMKLADAFIGDVTPDRCNKMYSEDRSHSAKRYKVFEGK